ncbi:MAG: AMP-binding protein [Betaproteobacteria bacterium]|nr:AMP-binding protein [Betaproteobacteria bacterium]
MKRTDRPGHPGSEMLFAALARRAPGDVILQGEGRAWRAAELCAAVDGLASALCGTRVLAVLADNGPAWVIAELAALRSGIVHLPLPGFFSPAQLAHALERTGTDAVLTDQPARVAELGAGFVRTGAWQGLTRMERSVPPVELPIATARISFTSGSTGAPKGVCLGAAGLIDTAAAVADRLRDLPIERHLSVLPLALLLENVAGVHAPLLRGARVDLPGLQTLGWRGMAGFDAAALQRQVVAAQPDSLILVPELLKAWTTHLAASRQCAPTGLDYVAVGGARVAPDLLARARALRLPAYQGYGLTECGSVVSLNRPGDDGDDVGRPLGHAAVRIEDGEVRIRTRAFLGYVGDPSAASIGTAPPEFATGDLGRIDPAGHLHLSGRRNSVLISSYGRNIAPEWVESVLLAQPEIAQAVVFGDGQPWLGAALVAPGGVDGARLALAVQRANAALPDYARVRRWLVVPPFSAQNGLATGNGRPIRSAIFSQHAAALAALHSDEKASNDVF